MAKHDLENDSSLESALSPAYVDVPTSSRSDSFPGEDLNARILRYRAETRALLKAELRAEVLLEERGDLRNYKVWAISTVLLGLAICLVNASLLDHAADVCGNRYARSYALNSSALGMSCIVWGWCMLEKAEGVSCQGFGYAVSWTWPFVLFGTSAWLQDTKGWCANH